MTDLTVDVVQLDALLRVFYRNFVHFLLTFNSMESFEFSKNTTYRWQRVKSSHKYFLRKYISDTILYKVSIARTKIRMQSLPNWQK